LVINFFAWLELKSARAMAGASSINRRMKDDLARRVMSMKGSRLFVRPCREAFAALFEIEQS
jgi:hypothetical protein